MNARQLEVFRAIMRDGTITAAANSLGISQPAVSKLLHHCESQLGYALFDRINGRLLPTMEAQLLYADADRVFRQIEALKSLARDVGAQKMGLLRLGASLPLAHAVLPAALRAFRARYPDVRIHLHTLPKKEIAEALLLGDLDFAVTLSPILAPTVRAERLAEVPVVAVLADGDPLTGRSQVEPEDLAGRTLISYGSHAEVGAALDAAFAGKGLVRSVAIQITSSVVAPPLVREGLGVALVDGLVAAQAGSGVVVRPFLPAVTTPVSLSVNQARPEPRFLAPFVADLRAAFAVQSAADRR